MLNGIFGKWLREFATLVLTQAVQAFLLAIVMTIVISCLGSSNSSDANTKNQAAGLLCIIALASFGKIEMLVKNIFGVTSQFGDPSLQNGARGLTAGGLLAMRGGKRLLDNGTKLVDSQRKINEAKKGLASIDDKTGGISSGTSPVTPELEEAPKVPGSETAENPIDGIKEAGGELLETSVRLQGLDDISSLSKAIDNLARQTEKSNGGSDRQKYEAMLKEGKDMRRSAIRENIGGMIGGTAGAIVGIAKGDDIIQTTLAGAGAGDAIGAATAQRKAARIDYNNKSQKLKEQIQNLSDEQYEANIKALEQSLAKNGLGNVKSRATFEIKNAPVGTQTISNVSATHSVNKNVRQERSKSKSVERPQNLSKKNESQE